MIYLKLRYITFDSRIGLHAQIYSSTHFYMNVSKHKSLYLNALLVRINFTELIHSKSTRHHRNQTFMCLVCGDNM